MILKINSLEEYKKASNNVSSGYRWFCNKEQINDPEFIAGYSWEITDPNLMKIPEIRDIFSPNTDICDKFIEYKDKICLVEKTTGVLIGIEITEEDFYYILKVDGKIRYFSCVCWIKLAE
jgi:hypothetical protein